MLDKQLVIKDLEKCRYCGDDLPQKFLSNGLKDRRIHLESCEGCKDKPFNPNFN